MTTEPMCYVGKAPCGCYLFASVDNPERAKENAKEIGKLIRAGWTIEKQTCQWVRDGNLNFDCPHRNCRLTKLIPQKKRG
jgi:hypothetical protein